MAHHPVDFTSLDKPLFPADGITKAELIAYYRAVAPHMLPYLRDRPINVECFPHGIRRPGFFQQAMPPHYPSWIAGVDVKKEGGSVRHVMVQDTDTLLYLVNQNCITLHAWLSLANRLDAPDQLIFDLDPPTGAGEVVRDVTRMLGELLDELGFVPFLKTSGSRGYHVAIPLDAEADFDTVRRFAQEVAEELASRDPKRITTEVRKQSRGRRVYVDTLRNAYAHTAVAPFTVRARPGAPVATPISWDELEDPKMTPARFTIGNLIPRLDRGIDPWKDFLRQSADLSKYI